MDDFLFHNPIFKSMDPEKLNFIMQFANMEKPKNMNQAMPFLLANMNKAKKQNISFSSSEVRFIAEILCKDLPSEEQAKIQKILSMLGPK